MTLVKQKILLQALMIKGYIFLLVDLENVWHGKLYLLIEEDLIDFIKIIN